MTITGNREKSYERRAKLCKQPYFQTLPSEPSAGYTRKPDALAAEPSVRNTPKPGDNSVIWDCTIQMFWKWCHRFTFAQSVKTISRFPLKILRLRAHFLPMWLKRRLWQVFSKTDYLLRRSSCECSALSMSRYPAQRFIIGWVGWGKKAELGSFYEGWVRDSFRGYWVIDEMHDGK